MYHQIGTLQIAPLHVLSHFAANVCPQGLPQTLTIPAIQKDKVGLLQMSKFEASKDFPQEPHHPHRTTSLFGDFKQIDMTTGRAAECTARAGISISFWWCCNLNFGCCSLKQCCSSHKTKPRFGGWWICLHRRIPISAIASLKSSYPSPAASVPKPGRRAGKEQTFKPRPEANLAQLLSKLLIYIYYNYVIIIK